jgi:hypothetical protein
MPPYNATLTKGKQAPAKVLQAKAGVCHLLEYPHAANPADIR